MTVISALFLFVVFLDASAQTPHFIYVQNEEKKPFNIQLNGQTFNSTASGYIIISQLLSGKYYVSIFFPKNIYPEQKFMIDINSEDRELALRKSSDNEWSLFDMIHFNTIISEKEPPLPQTSKDTTVVAKTEKNDSISIPKESNKIQLDDTIKTMPPFQQNKIIIQPEVKIHTSPSLKTTVAVNKIFEKIAAKGVDQIYIDKTNARFDTIALFIPINENDGIEKIKVAEPVKPMPITVNNPPIDLPGKQPCAATASDDDFLITRKQMATATTEEDMLRVAKIAMKGKCYTTMQLKNLSVLFISEKEKLRFFEIVKPFVADLQNFYLLQNQFSNPEYSEKFKLLLQRD